MIFPCLMLLSERDGNSRTGQIEEAGNGKIASNIQWCGGSAQEQRDAPRLSRDAGGRGAFEPVRRADLRRHGGFREEQRGVSAPIHAFGARPAEPRRVLAAVPDAGSGPVRGGSGAVRGGLGEGACGGGRPADRDRRQGAPAHLLEGVGAFAAASCYYRVKTPQKRRSKIPQSGGCEFVPGGGHAPRNESSPKSHPIFLPKEARVG